MQHGHHWLVVQDIPCRSSRQVCGEISNGKRRLLRQRVTCDSSSAMLSKAESIQALAQPSKMSFGSATSRPAVSHNRKVHEHLSIHLWLLHDSIARLYCPVHT